MKKHTQIKSCEHSSSGHVQMVVYATIATIFMIILLCFWGRGTATNHTIINYSITEIRKLDNTTVYTLDVSDISDTDRYSMHFKSFGNAIRVMADDNEIYEYGHSLAQGHLDVGRIYVSAFLPADVKTVEILLTTADANALSELTKIALCPIEESGRYYLSNDTLSFPVALIFVALGVGSFTVSFAIGAIEKKRRIQKAILFFSLSLLCVAIQLLDTGGHYLLLFQNQHTWNILFYFACYILQIVVPVYYYIVLGEDLIKRQRRIAYIGVWISVVYCIISTVLPLTTTLRFCDFYVLYPYTLVISVTFGAYAAVCLFRNKGYRNIYIPFLVGVLIWSIASAYLSSVPLATVHTSAITPLDVESFDSILLLNFLGMTLFIFLQNEIQEKELQYERVIHLENELQIMRYKVFSSQMQPHFLYNALSSIRQIIYEDANYASALLGDFSVHLRGTIRAMSNDRPIAFAEELKNIEAYVRIEKMRFGDKLTMHYDIQTDSFRIVPLSIQPLVENAIRHGVYQNGEKGGTVTLQTRDTESDWVIVIVDTGVGFDVESVLNKVESGEKDSVGLKNLIFRLENLMHADVRVESEIGIGTQITVSIPKI